MNPHTDWPDVVCRTRPSPRGGGQGHRDGITPRPWTPVSGVGRTRAERCCGGLICGDAAGSSPEESGSSGIPSARESLVRGHAGEAPLLVSAALEMGHFASGFAKGSLNVTVCTQGRAGARGAADATCPCWCSQTASPHTPHQRPPPPNPPDSPGREQRGRCHTGRKPPSRCPRQRRSHSQSLLLYSGGGMGVWKRGTKYFFFTSVKRLGEILEGREWKHFQLLIRIRLIMGPVSTGLTLQARTLEGRRGRC